MPIVLKNWQGIKSQNSLWLQSRQQIPRYVHPWIYWIQVVHPREVHATCSITTCFTCFLSYQFTASCCHYLPHLHVSLTLMCTPTVGKPCSHYRETRIEIDTETAITIASLSHGRWLLRQGNHANQYRHAGWLHALTSRPCTLHFLTSVTGPTRTTAWSNWTTWMGRRMPRNRSACASVWRIEVKAAKKWRVARSFGAKAIADAMVSWCRVGPCGGVLWYCMVVCSWFVGVCMTSFCENMCVYVLAVHTADIHRGNRLPRHNCWIFRKCSKPTMQTGIVT